MNESIKSSQQAGPGTKVAVGGSFISAFAGLIGASCCILPLLLFNAGIGTAIVSKLQFFADKKGYFLIGALLFLVLGIAASFWGGKRPAKRVIVTFGLSALVILLAYVLPSFEGDILRWTGLR